MTGIKVLFPISRFEVAKGGNIIDGPMIIETHFSFRSLLPEGVVLNGNQIDLEKYAALLQPSRKPPERHAYPKGHPTPAAAP
ncbi:MAG TPA: hypothetical protein VF585_07385 [Chthoniobacterales bacterium]|jgi:hypothetical protein